MNSNRRQFQRPWQALIGGLALAFGHEANAGSFSSDFNNGVEYPAMLNGAAYWADTGGVGGSGVVRLTDAINAQIGTMILDDLDYGVEITGFTARFKMKIGGGTAVPADGLSFVFSPELYNWWLFSEDGVPSGVSICFDTYNNGGGEAPSIDVKVNGFDVATAKGTLDMFRTGDFVEVFVQAHPGGALDLTVNGTPVFTGLPGVFARSWGMFGFGARTGGLNDNHLIDDVEITTTSAPPQHPFVVSMSPTGTGVNEETTVQLVLQDGVGQVVPGTVTMTFDGATVPATVEKNGEITTVSYDPPGALGSGTAHSVTVAFTDNGSPATTQIVSFNFQTRFLVGPTGNLYELVVTEWWVTWDEANFEAQNRTMFGRPGHLATLTSYEEDLFGNKVRSTSLPVNPGREVWIGGFQPYGQLPKDGWQWVNGEGSISGENGGATYANWIANEPNDNFGPDSENYLALGLNGLFGWNDSGQYGIGRLQGYIVEYEALPVALDIKPAGSPNIVNIQEGGKLPVAVLSTSTFDARTVDVSTIRFGRTGVEAAPVSSSVADVNGDGLADVMLHFVTADLGLRCGDSSALLIARAVSGTPLKGVDSVEIRGCPTYGLSVAALQDVNHNTDVQLTVTPLLAGYTAPSAANQVQLKSYTIAGKLGWTKTVNSLALTANGSSSVGTLAFADLQRGQKIDAKVNVPNSKSGKSEVLRGDARVLHRPDLALGTVIAPTQVRTYQAVNINVPLRELQGDLGAKASAQLVVNDVVVDTISGITVPAGGQVGLMFTTRLQAEGVYNVKIIVNNVTPGDFDTSNNEAAFVVEASQPPITPGTFDLQYYHEEYENRDDWDSEFASGSNYNLYKSEYVNGNFFFDAFIGFPMQHAALTILADGLQKVFHVSDAVPGIVEDYGCDKYAYGSVPLGANTWAYIQSSRDCYGNQWSWVQLQRNANHQTYFSTFYDKIWGVRSTYGSSGGSGTYLDATTSLNARLILRTAEGDFGGNADIPFIDYSSYYAPWEYTIGGETHIGFDRSVYASGYNSGALTP